MLLLLTLLIPSQTVSPTVEGDVALMEVLRDAQRANEGRFTYGELVATVDSGLEEDGVPNQHVEAHLFWDGERYRFEGSATVLKIPAGYKSSEFEPTVRITTIRDGSKYTMFNPDQRLASVFLPEQMGPFPHSDLRPAKTWYRLSNRPWIELLGPHPNFPQTGVKGYVVRRLPGDLVEVVRRHDDGLTVRLVAALKDDGNIISYEGKDSPSGRRSRGEFHWKRDAKGRCFLDSSYKVLHGYSDFHKKSVTGFVSYKTVKFDADAKPPARLFDHALLISAAGTRVEDKVRNRVYKVGADRPEGFGKELDALADEMRARGFAKPGR